ncbi:MAG: heme ABC transporter permease [Gammaproteobacteria bacterium]|jgi:heme exporter protein C
MFESLTKYASPQIAYGLAGRLIPWFGWTAALLFIAGLYGGLVYAPPDYQQGDGFRIIYVHVPAAWLSLFTYMVMASAGAAGLIWKTKVSDAVARNCAPLGAAFTFLALCTGSLWGKPMWGTYWVWDARLTSELILLFLYLGYMALQSAIEERRTAARAGAVLALVGVVNIPIIHYSVIWWNTLHQGPTITLTGAPTMATSMLIPLLIMTLAYMCYFAAVLLVRVRGEILQQERNSHWVRQLILEGGN